VNKRRRVLDESGMTLAELSVVMVLFGVLASLILAVTISALRSQGRTLTRATDIAAQKTGFERMTRSIRQADPLLACSPSAVSLQTSDTTGATTVDTWSIVGSAESRQLVLDKTKSGVVQPRTMVLLHVASGAPGFSYWGGTCSAPEDVIGVVIDLSAAGEPSVQGLFDRVEIRNRP
jgi:prepilin-type N-terminal cleavage/methylation domain-containing protein